MGINIYAKWKGQTKKEKEAQITGFDTLSGKVGYLREAYHGEPYATQYLLKEAFDSKSGEAYIPAAILKERLILTLEIVRERQEKLYQASEKEIKRLQESFTAFVDLCEKKEKETGEPTLIQASY